MLYKDFISFTTCTIVSKGQLISEWLFGVLNFPKNNRKIFYEFLPKNLKSGQIIKQRHSIIHFNLKIAHIINHM